MSKESWLSRIGNEVLDLVYPPGLYCICCGKITDDSRTYRLCNDCVLYAEVGFELGQIKDIEELINAMEDKRLEADCKFILEDEKRQQAREASELN